MRNATLVISLSVLWLAAAPAGAQLVGPKPIGSYGAGAWDSSAAEIPAYDPLSRRLFVVNATIGVDVLDISDPTLPTKITTIAAPGTNSVSVRNGVLAIAQQAATKTDPGTVLFYSANDATFAAPLNSVPVGALPDMLTFTPDGTKVVVANEGEPNDAYTIDPEGSVSVIDLSGGVAAASVSHVLFTGFNGQEAALNAAGVRISGPAGTAAAMDIEPEYVAISADGTTAFVTLQENNAVARIDLTDLAAAPVLTTLGRRDHRLPGQGLDANKNDDVALIENLPIFGLPMADGIASYSVNGATYYVTANEGDGREYVYEDGNGNEITAFTDETALADVNLDPAVFDQTFRDRAADDKNDIGDLAILSNLGDTDGDGDLDEIYAFGGRSFSIFDAAGNLVYDSKDDFEQITAIAPGVSFNATNDEQDIDDRSDNKGPEPESVEIAEIDGRAIAFIGLERVGGFMVYDITDPANPSFIQYVNPRDFAIPNGDLEAEVLAASGTLTADLGALDLGPEGLLFIAAADSPLPGQALLVVANEVSGTTSIYAVPEPASAALVGLGGLLLLARRRR